MGAHNQQISQWLTDLSSNGLIDLVSDRLSNELVSTIDEIRRARLVELIVEYDTMTNLAMKLGHNGTAQLSQWKTAAPNAKTGRPRVISDDSARKIEALTGKPRGWMDSPPDDFQSAISQATTRDETALLAAYRLLDETDRERLLADAEYRARIAVIERKKQKSPPKAPPSDLSRDRRAG